MDKFLKYEVEGVSKIIFEQLKQNNSFLYNIKLKHDIPQHIEISRDALTASLIENKLFLKALKEKNPEIFLKNIENYLDVICNTFKKVKEKQLWDDWKNDKIELAVDSNGDIVTI